MKFDFKKHRHDHLLGGLIISGLSGIVDELIEGNKKKLEKYDGIYDLIITIDGMELDPQKFCDRWEEDVDRLIQEKALEIIREKFCDLDDKIEEVTELMDSIIKDKINEIKQNFNNPGE